MSSKILTLLLPSLMDYLCFWYLIDSLLNKASFSHRRKHLNLERLEAQLKACHCRIVFSKAKVWIQ